MNRLIWLKYFQSQINKWRDPMNDVEHLFLKDIFLTIYIE